MSFDRRELLMAQREVTRTGKASDGDITKLCNPSAWWSPRMKDSAIRDIEEGKHTYYVKWKDKRTEVHVVDGPNGKYLRTDHDDTTRNNLLDLPDCRE